MIQVYSLKKIVTSSCGYWLYVSHKALYQNCPNGFSLPNKMATRAKNRKIIYDTHAHDYTMVNINASRAKDSGEPSRATMTDPGFGLPIAIVAKCEEKINLAQKI